MDKTERGHGNGVKVNLLLSSSVLLVFLPLEISDKKSGVGGKDNPPNNLVASPQII